LDTSYPHIKSPPSALDRPRPYHRRDDLIRILGVPEARQSNPWEDDDEDSKPWAWAGVFLWLGIVALVALGFALGLMIGRIDDSAVLDFLAPTAAQARDTGWAAIAEGL